MRGFYLGFVGKGGENFIIDIETLRDVHDDKKLSRKNMNKVLKWLKKNTDKKTGKLKKMDFTKISNINTIFNTLGIGKSYIEQKVSNLESLLEEYVKEEEDIIKEANKKVITTREYVSKSNIEVRREITLNDEQSQFINEREELEDIDERNAEILFRRIEKYLKNNGGLRLTDKKTGEDLLVVYNTTDLFNTLNSENGEWVMGELAKHFGYKDSRGFFSKFLSGSIWTYEQEKEGFQVRLENIQKLKEVFNRGSEEEKINAFIRYISDMDSDGIIRTDTKKVDGISEIRLSEYVKNSEDIQNLLDNLGFLPHISNFVDSIYFKEDFTTRLIDVIKMGVPFTVLTQNRGYEKFMEERLIQEEKYKKAIEEGIDQKYLENKVARDFTKKGFIGKIKSKFGKSKNEIIREKFDEAVSIARVATVGIALGHTKGVGVNSNLKEWGFDIEKITRGIIDGLNIGMDSKGNIGIGLNTNIVRERLKGYGISLDAGASFNNLGTSLSVDKSLFNETNDSNIKLIMGAGISVSGHPGYTLNAITSNSENVPGINAVLIRESKTFDFVINKIKNDLGGELNITDAEINNLYERDLLHRSLNKKELAAAKENMQHLKNKYDALIKNIPENHKDLAIAKLKKASLENIVNKLFRRGAEGLHFVGIGGFLIPGVIGGVYPIFEYNWTKYEVNNNEDGNEIAGKITSIPLASFIEKYGKTQGIEYIKLDGDGLKLKKEEVNYRKIGDGILEIPGENGFVIIKPKTGYNLDVNGIQNYRSDMKKNVTRKSYILDIRSYKASEKILEDIPNDKFSNLRASMNSIENLFSYKTRYNVEKGSLLNPKATTEQRWDGLKKLWKKALRNKKTEAYLKKTGYDGVGLLAKNNTLGEIIKSVKNDKSKQEYIISRVIQFLKKAKNFGQGSEKAWNEKTSEFINVDRKRNGKFDKIWEEESVNLINERKAYYKKLEDGKGKITTVTRVGFSFDAAATKITQGGNSDNGVDVMKGDLDMLAVDGRPLMIEITDSENIKNLKKLAGKYLEDTENLKFFLNKDPHGGNDRVLVLREIGGGGNIDGQIGSTSDSINQINNSIGLVPVWTWDEKKSEKKKPEEKKPEEKKKKKPKKPKKPKKKKPKDETETIPEEEETPIEDPKNPKNPKETGDIKDNVIEEDGKTNDKDSGEVHSKTGDEEIRDTEGLGENSNKVDNVEISTSDKDLPDTEPKIGEENIQVGEGGIF